MSVEINKELMSYPVREVREQRIKIIDEQYKILNEQRLMLDNQINVLMYERQLIIIMDNLEKASKGEIQLVPKKE
jgi:hypothetical protein